MTPQNAANSFDILTESIAPVSLRRTRANTLVAGSHTTNIDELEQTTARQTTRLEESNVMSRLRPEAGIICDCNSLRSQFPDYHPNDWDGWQHMKKTQWKGEENKGAACATEGAAPPTGQPPYNAKQSKLQDEPVKSTLPRAMPKMKGFIRRSYRFW